MKKLLSCILALVLGVSLFSGLTYADESPAAPGVPVRTPSFDVETELLESEESEKPGEPEGPGEPEMSAESDAFREDLFSDVSAGDWFFNNVKDAYELGLMQGCGEGVFSPLGSISLAETVTIAVRLRSAHMGDGRDFSGGTPWYAPAVEYAVAQGIIREGDFSDYAAQATRAQVAYILSGALPSGAMGVMNTVEDNSLPDVKMNDAYAANIYFLYRTGILSGRDQDGTFSPSGATTRAEVAAIASRISNASLRVKCEFHAPPAYPDLSLRERADDSFFSDAAFLGNSLVEGLRLYAKFKTVDYYSGTSMSVVSALYTKNVLLRNGTYGTQLDAMAQKQYGKVYIELGINEISGSVTTFIKNYRALLDKIRAAQPDADIYIMAITPVSKAKSQAGTFTRERVIMYNTALYKLAGERECYYLDDFTPLADSEGYLPKSQTWDGVHFTVAKYAEWETVIRTHYA